MYNHGKFFDYFLYAQLTHSPIYYSLVDVMIHTTIHLSKHHLPSYFLKLQWERLHCVHLRHCLYHVASCKNFNKILIWIPSDDHVLFIMEEMFWANLFFNVGGLFFIFPLEGNTFIAQDQHILYTYHEWR